MVNTDLRLIYSKLRSKEKEIFSIAAKGVGEGGGVLSTNVVPITYFQYNIIACVILF